MSDSGYMPSDFTRYDQHAVQQMNCNIELIRYRRLGDGLLSLELVNAAATASGAGPLPMEQLITCDTVSRDV